MEIDGSASQGIVSPLTPIHQAVESEDCGELTRLLDAGGDPNEVCCGLTLLVHAIELEGDSALQSGDPVNSALTAIVLAYGADPDVVAPSGHSPADMARLYSHEMALRLLGRFRGSVD